MRAGRSTKTFLSFVLFLASPGLVSTAFAQGIAPPRLTSSPTPEAPFPTPTPTPSPTPARRTSNETKAPTAEESPRAVAAPRRDVLREKPVRAVESPEPLLRRATAQPPPKHRASQPTFDLSGSSWVTAATIRSLENRWEGAVKDHDDDALDELLASDFEGTSPKDSTASKRRMLALLRRDTNTYKSAKAHGMTVKNRDPKTVVVTGTSVESGLTESGKKFKVARNFTDTWKQRGDSWKCVESRVSHAEVH